ncbi:8-amino-7-oxononanoate synthase [Oscillatoria sp. FACHB-1407]|uniref:8-amino-7-oxononanoate synthase n=1 Tax=Oscillatoria sp. FACHB-1407 TaxID=2692847 RepID=UPI0018EF6836|nr:8-amino-7-oxononanoate synthase [Oscillatoria sp. FACHB-1407]
MVEAKLFNKFEFVEQKLQQRREAHQFRVVAAFDPDSSVQGTRGDRSFLNFSSNDYLGLSKHPHLIETAQRYTQRYGTGATASRLVTGTYPIHQQLEHQLAIACGYEATLLFSSGFQANSTVLPALLDASALVLCDRLVHNSLIQGILASHARFMRYRHNDLTHLKSLLEKAARQSYSRIMIVSETVFSMDGDRSDVTALVQLAQDYNAILYLDDAHALGVMGKQGMGLAAHQPGIDIVVGTFGKAFGAFGAFVACSQKLRDYLVNYCPGFIYTTALPPAVVGAIAAALELVPTLGAERQHLNHLADHLRQQLSQLNYDPGNSSSQIVPVMVGDEAKTLRLSQWLEQRGMLAIAIRPPTVEPGTARLRVALSSQHTVAQVDALIHAIGEWHESSH